MDRSILQPGHPSIRSRHSSMNSFLRGDPQFDPYEQNSIFTSSHRGSASHKGLHSLPCLPQPPVELGKVRCSDVLSGNTDRLYSTYHTDQAALRVISTKISRAHATQFHKIGQTLVSPAAPVSEPSCLCSQMCISCPPLSHVECHGCAQRSNGSP